MLSHCITVSMRKPADPQALLSWNGRAHLKVKHRCHLAIMECKRGPSRCARGEVLMRAIENLLLHATTDLLEYSAVYFKFNKQASAVIGITSAGGYWRWAMIKRTDVPSYDTLREKAWLNRADKQALMEHQAQFVALFAGRPWQYLGQPASDAEWTKLRDVALIPLLESHAADYPEVMQWAQADKGKGKMKQFTVGKSGSPSKGKVVGRNGSPPKGRVLRSAGKAAAK
ncbi:hypothetical protein C8T65DRAFT_643051 [Cerioporus squamosus]|nr:hypothetical protein C8T65DRAFT_643051 [Cerioporus squamosus]